VHVVVNGESYGYRELRERREQAPIRFTTDSDSENPRCISIGTRQVRILK